MIAEYRRSLKMPEAEEILDLVFYRPLAFLFVKIVYRTPITPNQVTILSGIAGLVAARMFSIGSTSAMTWGSLWYAFANILDCADGQLARLQKSGTLLGRVIDGFADYISSIAIFIGIGLGLSGTGAWWLVLAGGLSSAIHAMFFDHYQSEFISTVRGERNSLVLEIEQFSRELERLRADGRRQFRIAMLSLYVRYLGLQKSTSTRHENAGFDPAVYKSENALMIRLWSLLGPTTNRTLLIVCSLFGTLQLYLWIVVTVGNAWLIVAYLLQRRIHRRLDPRTSAVVNPLIEK